MKAFFSFKKLVLPVIAKVFFWVGFAFFSLVAISGLIGGLLSDLGGVFILQSFLLAAIGIPVVRVISELLLMAHKNHEHLNAIRKSLEKPVETNFETEMDNPVKGLSHLENLDAVEAEQPAAVRSYV